METYLTKIYMVNQPYLVGLSRGFRWDSLCKSWKTLISHPQFAKEHPSTNYNILFLQCHVVEPFHQKDCPSVLDLLGILLPMVLAMTYLNHKYKLLLACVCQRYSSNCHQNIYLWAAWKICGFTSFAISLELRSFHLPVPLPQIWDYFVLSNLPEFILSHLPLHEVHK